MEYIRLVLVNGETLKEEGIILSGHKFAAKDYTQESGDVRGILEENVTFVKEPLEALAEIIRNRGYNNYGRGGSNDIMLVRIPTDKLDGNSPDIIVQYENDMTCLNPKYVQGYIRIDVKGGTFQGVCIDENVQTSERSYSIEETLKRFSQKANTRKTADIKQKVMSMFKKLLRPKEKEIDNKQRE